ncbi:hypothetical protein GCM10011383_12810 [Hymenobacter cavernae]|uniref:Peptidase A2 domain-containing protein n=2 Tax=Hymenobacter cavernae TaxID=2044852 RepID=A0ABQ1TT79_9BACT|nr:hypothetical protein GCM10011383_12810 [Hymenobacter cavernae]
MAHPAVAHAALLVPVRLAGCARTCYLQFDTGAPYSLLYAKPLAALRVAYPAMQRTLLPQHDTIQNFSFNLGSGRVQAGRLPVLRYGASQLPADNSPFIIGTLGADVLANQVLVLDYPRRRFTLLPRVPDSLARQAAFVPLDFANRRVILRAALQGQAHQFLFDSGSSAFSLLTSQSTWQDLGRQAAIPQINGVNSWGKTLVAHTLPSDATLQFAGSSVPLRTVTYMEGTSLLQQALMRFSGMNGMLGNEPFRHHTIILDVQAGRFGLVPH